MHVNNTTINQLFLLYRLRSKQNTACNTPTWQRSRWSRPPGPTSCPSCTSQMQPNSKWGSLVPSCPSSLWMSTHWLLWGPSRKSTPGGCRPSTRRHSSWPLLAAKAPNWRFPVYRAWHHLTGPPYWGSPPSLSLCQGGSQLLPGKVRPSLWMMMCLLSMPILSLFKKNLLRKKSWVNSFCHRYIYLLWRCKNHSNQRYLKQL